MAKANIYTIINEFPFYNWVKRIRQAHLSRQGESRTLCGMPMLGSNYARAYKREDWKKSEDCYRKAKIISCM